MDMKKYITLVESAAKPLEVKAKPVQPKTEPAPLVHISESYESSPAIRKIVRNVMEKKDPQPPKQRNPVAKNANAALGGGAAGKHKDRKKDAKQGVQKHKGQSLDEDDTGSTDKGEFKRRELEHELGHETRSGAVYIDGKYWKTFDTFKQAQNVARSLERKGKRATARMLESYRPPSPAQKRFNRALEKQRNSPENTADRESHRKRVDAIMPPPKKDTPVGEKMRTPFAGAAVGQKEGPAGQLKAMDPKGYPKGKLVGGALEEGRVCPQCGSSKCSCPPGKCKCKPVAGFKPKMKEDKDPCWDNYKMVGTKKKGGKTVPNCVPKESRVGEAQNAAQQAAIAIAKKKKKAVAEDMRTKADFRKETGDAVSDFLNKGGKIKEVPPNKVRVKPGQSLASKHIGSKSEAGRVVGKDRKINSKQPVVSTEHMGETQLDELDRPSGKLYIIITADNAGAPHVFGDFGSFPQDVMHKIAKRGTRDKLGAKTKLKIDFLFDDFRTTLQQLRTIFKDVDFIGAEAAEFIIKSSALRSDQGEDVKQLKDYIENGDDRRMKMYQAPEDDEEEGEPTGGNILRIDPETGAARRVVGVKPQTQMGGHAVAQPTTFKYTLLKTELMPKLRDMGFKFDGNQIILRADQRDKLKNMLGSQFQSVFGQKGTFKEGGEKYKIKTTGSDINPATGKRADYYISPSTGKKVYKKAKVGDHENPNSGEHKPKVEGRLSQAIIKEFGLK
jgi:hypothetical protein